MSEMRPPSELIVSSFHLPGASARISSLRRGMGQTSPEENLRVLQNARHKYTNFLIPGSLNLCLGNGNFTPLEPDGGKGKPA